MIQQLNVDTITVFSGLQVTLKFLLLMWYLFVHCLIWWVVSDLEATLTTSCQVPLFALVFFLVPLGYWDLSPVVSLSLMRKSCIKSGSLSLAYPLDPYRSMVKTLFCHHRKCTALTSLSYRYAANDGKLYSTELYIRRSYFSTLGSSAISVMVYSTGKG